MREHDDFVVQSLVEERLVSAEDAAAVRRTATERRVSPLEVLVERRLADSRAVAVALASICEVPYVDLANHAIDLRNARSLPRSLAETVIAMPLFVVDGLATIGMADPMDLRAVDQIRAAIGIEIEPVLCEAGPLRTLIDRAYAMAGTDVQQTGATPERPMALTTGKEPAVAAVNQIINQAVERGASDIHIGPDDGRLHLRLRVDGVLHQMQGPPLSLHAGIVQRLKVMAHLDLTQTRRPQDGKIRFEATTTSGTRPVDIRLSLVPTICGENVVMRVLNSAAAIADFPALGMSKASTDAMNEMLAHPNGMLLVTGPTGSGKTTTLYTALSKLNTPERNVVTIEDPVEIRLPMIRQIQTNAEIGLTFAGALRSVLRQDPDIVLVGEIRDDETARIAMQAALTGHLVLSSLHTNDAIGAIPRLREFGCPVFAIASALRGVVAQRLVRRICGDCVKACVPSETQQRQFHLTATEKFSSGAGCARCSSSGYKGRLGLYEILHVVPAIVPELESGDAQRITRAAHRSGMRPMWQDGLEKARLGLTTLDEVTRMAAIVAMEEAPAQIPTSTPPPPTPDKSRLAA